MTVLVALVPYRDGDGGGGAGKGPGLGWRNEFRLEYAETDVPVAHVGEW